MPGARSATCVEPTSLQKVFGTFKTKKDGYLKQWETLHGQPEAKKAVCDRFKSKLGRIFQDHERADQRSGHRLPQLLLLLIPELA